MFLVITNLMFAEILVTYFDLIKTKLKELYFMIYRGQNNLFII